MGTPWKPLCSVKFQLRYIGHLFMEHHHSMEKVIILFHMETACHTRVSFKYNFCLDMELNIGCFLIKCPLN